MARGGYRVGAGRPKSPQPGWVLPIATEGGMSPLEYMLSVIRDPNADTVRRDSMALAAAPYCHPKVVDRWGGKKEIAAQKAKTALKGSEWGDDLANILKPNGNHERL